MATRKKARPRETNPFDDVVEAPPTPGKVYKGEPYVSVHDAEMPPVRADEVPQHEHLPEREMPAEDEEQGPSPEEAARIIDELYDKNPNARVKALQWEPTFEGLRIGQTFPLPPAAPLVSITDLQVISNVQVVFYLSYTGPGGRLPLAEFKRRFR